LNVFHGKEKFIGGKAQSFSSLAAIQKVDF